MKKNMGITDRWVRIVLAIAFIVAYFTDLVTGTPGIVLLVLAGIFILTALVRFCPLYAPFGIRTCPREAK